MTDTDFIEIAFKLWRDVQLDSEAERSEPGHLYAAIAGAPARNWQDVAFKLAIWRWNPSCLPDSQSSLSARDRLVYSAFRDAVKLSGRPDLSMPIDEETHHFAELLTEAKAA